MSVITKTDFWLSLLVLSGGIWAFFQSRLFDDASRSYPLFLSALFILLGLALLFKTIKDSDNQLQSITYLYSRVSGPLLVALLLVVWVLLLMMNIGYLLSSIIILLPVLWLLGYRNITFILIMAAGVVAVIFILFWILFDIPLPLNPFLENVLH
ncbi:MAG: hypothetical protein CR981_02150 [Proteobacteria bacterium]|nr:MAG: hypothetical protein CR981_02150 [Pseudomonadota bacterium]